MDPSAMEDMGKEKSPKRRAASGRSIGTWRWAGGGEPRRRFRCPDGKQVAVLPSGHRHRHGKMARPGRGHWGCCKRPVLGK